MYDHPETNPHFISLQPPPPQHVDQHSQPPGPWVSQPQRQGQQIQPSQPRRQDQQTQPRGPQVLQPQLQGQQPSARTRQPRQPRQRGKEPASPFTSQWAPKHEHEGQQSIDRIPLGTVPHIHGQPLGPWSQLTPPQHEGQLPSGPSSSVTKPQHPGQPPTSPWIQKSPQGQLSRPQSPPVPHVPPVPEALDRGHKPQPHSPQHEDRPQTLIRPRPRKTNWTHWFIAAFCTIFWVVIILGGLVVLIVYLVFRPHSPRFDVSSATLNAAYLDMGYLLNADLTVLANFTNPNKKVTVYFSYVTIDLYHGNTLIATQYIEPFKAAKKQSRFADVHMVTSQVQLPLKESQQLQKEIDSNRVQFEIKGVFHARSILGNFLGYSYRLYAHCYIEVTSPPSGVLRASKCKTKR